LIARDTVMKETPALAATSLIVARRPCRPGFFGVACSISSGLIDLLEVRKPFSRSAAVFPDFMTGSSMPWAKKVPARGRDSGVDFVVQGAWSIAQNFALAPTV
jgi:hypothetical protein